MRFVAVGQSQQFLAAARPATVGSAVGLQSGLAGLSVAWDRIELPHGRIALRTAYGCFLSCQREGMEVPRLMLTEDMGPREAFEEILWPQGEVSLRSCELTFLSLAPDLHGISHSLSPTAEATSERERFRYHDLPREVLTAVEDVISGQPQVPNMPRQFAPALDNLRDIPKTNPPA